MADNDQYPPTTALRRINPTLTNAKVVKFKPSNGFQTVEEKTDETGATFLYNGVNYKYKYDVEIIPLAGFTEPRELTALQFVTSTSASAQPFPGAIVTDGVGHINGVIVGPVESAQDEAGHIAMYSFKIETTANTPNPNT